jgi:hypothetical protein
MNCRNFHRNLEDYLEGSLDFPGRFGMERHAQQCIGCGKEMAGAQRLHQMASELNRVKAPSNFESSVLEEIGKRKYHRRFFSVQRFWIYGPAWPSWRKMILASSSLAALALGIFLVSRRAIPEQASFPPQIANKPEKLAAAVQIDPVVNANAYLPKQAAASEAPRVAKKVRGSPFLEREILQDQEAAETEFVELMMMGQDNRPVPIRLPRKIRMQYSHPSEESYIWNVSH